MFVFYKLDGNNCPLGWVDLMGKCLKLLCGTKSFKNARTECSKNEADLASLDSNSLPQVVDYFERIRVRMTGYTTVSVGLSRVKRQWSWLDGRIYNQSLGFQGSKARLSWNKKNGKWGIEPSDMYNDLHLCEKMRGKTEFGNQ